MGNLHWGGLHRFLDQRLRIVLRLHRHRYERRENEYRGEPLFTLEAQIQSFEDLRPGDNEIRLSLFWSPSGKTTVGVDQLIEQESLSVRVNFPNLSTIHIFHPPSRERPRRILAPETWLT